MADYSMIGSFSEGGASALNGDIITKLREAEEKSVIAPIETRLEDWDSELEKVGEIDIKLKELLTAVKAFDLFNSGNNAFEQITANTTGTSTVFDATDLGALEVGTTNVTIAHLASKDVHQTADTFTDSTDSASGLGDADDKLKITVGSSYDTGTTTEISTDQSFEDMVTAIKAIDGVTASIEEVATGEYRVVIRSTQEGEDNNIFLGEDQANATGTDTTQEETDVGFSDMLKSRNLEATVDGIDYDVSSNSITVADNLKITATSIGDSSISIQRDDSFVIPALEDIATKYNELVEIVNKEVYSGDGVLEDVSGMRTILNGIKNILFDSQGTGADEKTLFSYGTAFGFDNDGYLQIDTAALGTALTENFDAIKALFIGVAEDEGIGTQLTAYINDLSAYNGLMTMYADSMTERKSSLEEEKEKNIATLDAKYSMMAAQFVAYGSVIAQMEAGFGGLKQMMSDANSD